MVETVATLTWQDTTDATAPVADYAVNFATDSQWQFFLDSSYHGSSLQPAGVLIDNSANPVAVTALIGGTTLAGVPAYQRQSILLPAGSVLFQLICPAAQTTLVQFFVKKPLPDILASFQAQIAAQQQAVQQLVRSYIAGLTFSVDLTSPNTVLDISAGACTDSTNTTSIILPGFTKSIAGAWAGGTGAPGLGTGVVVAGPMTLHVFAIVVNGVPDVYFDTSISGANKPAGTTALRFLESIMLDGASHIVSFSHIGDTMLFSTELLLFNNAGFGPGFSLLVGIGTPTDRRVWALIRAISNNATNPWNFWIWAGDLVVPRPTLPVMRGPVGGFDACQLDVLTDLTASINMGPDAALTAAQIFVAGWRGTVPRFTP